MKKKPQKFFAEDTTRTILPIALTFDHHRLHPAHGACRFIKKSRKTQAINVKDDKHAQAILMKRLAMLEAYSNKIGLWLDYSIEATGFEHNDL